MKIISDYSPKNDVSIDFSHEETLTKQAFKKECDINFIMSQYEKTGLVDFVNANEPQYGDVPAFDFQSSLNTIIQGQSMFAELPALVRRQFDNDPYLFLSFVQDPQNRDQCVAMGLITAPEVSGGVSPSANIEGAPAPVPAAPAATPAAS